MRVGWKLTQSVGRGSDGGRCWTQAERRRTSRKRRFILPRQGKAVVRNTALIEFSQKVWDRPGKRPAVQKGSPPFCSVTPHHSALGSRPWKPTDLLPPHVQNRLLSGGGFRSRTALVACIICLTSLIRVFCAPRPSGNRTSPGGAREVPSSPCDPFLLRPAGQEIRPP